MTYFQNYYIKQPSGRNVSFPPFLWNQKLAAANGIARTTNAAVCFCSSFDRRYAKIVRYWLLIKADKSSVFEIKRLKFQKRTIKGAIKVSVLKHCWKIKGQNFKPRHKRSNYERSKISSVRNNFKSKRYKAVIGTKRIVFKKKNFGSVLL